MRISRKNLQYLEFNFIFPDPIKQKITLEQAIIDLKDSVVPAKEGNKTNKELEYMEKGIQVLQEQGIDVFQLINDNNLGDSAAKVTQAIINL